jgi:hypothetical protein
VRLARQIIPAPEEDIVTLRLLLAVLFICASLNAQHRVDARNRYVRVMAIVPLVGSGTPDDPTRPDYAPLPPNAAVIAAGTKAPEGIIGFSYQVSDDGKFGLVEFVARSRDVFKSLLADTRPGVKAFIKGQNTRAEIEAAFQAVKAGFNVDSLVTVVP